MQDPKRHGRKLISQHSIRPLPFLLTPQIILSLTLQTAIADYKVHQMEFVSEIHGNVKSPETRPKFEIAFAQEDNRRSRRRRRRQSEPEEAQDETNINDDSDSSESRISERLFVSIE
jgi:hypothetical protein